MKLTICSTRSLMPRPHLQGGKESGELGTNPWAYAEKFPHTNQIAALALSYHYLTTGI